MIDAKTNAQILYDTYKKSDNGDYYEIMNDEGI